MSLSRGKSAGTPVELNLFDGRRRRWRTGQLRELRNNGQACVKHTWDHRAMRERTVRDYEKRVERVLRHIVERLDEIPAPDEYAAIASFSRFHFHRIFRGVTGESIADLTRRLKLERAAVHLREDGVSVTRAAMAAGYESGEAFSRAFKRCAGITPSAYRTAWPPPALGPRDARVRYRPADGLITLESANGGLPMDVTIESYPAMHYARISHIGPYPGVGPCFERLYAWAGERGVLGSTTKCFSLSYDDPDAVDTNALRSDACISLGNFRVESAGEVQTHVLPASRYAVHRHVGSYDGISAAYRRMFGRWLPASGERVAERPCMEIYESDVATTPTSRLETLLCIPLDAETGL